MGEEDQKKDGAMVGTEAEGLTTQEAALLRASHGRNELPRKRRSKLWLFLKQLWGPMPALLWLAVVIELAIENFADTAILLTILFVNALIGWYEEGKAGDAVAALESALRPTALAKRDGKWLTIDAAELVPGDAVMLSAGKAVPADCLVLRGPLDVDQSVVTGESRPVKMWSRDVAPMGATVVRGEVEAVVKATGRNTLLGRTATLLQTPPPPSRLQRLVFNTSAILLGNSLFFCAVAFAFLLSRGEPFRKVLDFVVVLLVASIPLALEIVTTCTLAVGSRQLAAQGVIVSRLTAVEEMARVDMLCCDKTGTLTLNKMTVQEDCPIFTRGESFTSVLLAAVLATRWMEPAKDAVDSMVLAAGNLQSVSGFEQLEYVAFDSLAKRSQATVRAPDGSTFKVTKGSPQVILELAHNRRSIEAVFRDQVQQLAARGLRCLAVARSDREGVWNILGLLTFTDPPRPDAAITLVRARAHGIAVKMLTGDQLVVAMETAKALGMGENIRSANTLPIAGPDGELSDEVLLAHGRSIATADGFAELIPEQKVAVVEALRRYGYVVGMTGDGVNDAPALKRADVGVAVAGSTDAAVVAADMVLTTAGLSAIFEAVLVARCIFQRVKSFVTYRVAATLQLLLFFFVACFLSPNQFLPRRTTAQWPSFFSLPVVMLMLITLLNDGTLVTIGYDRVRPSRKPDHLSLTGLFLVSWCLAGVAYASSLLLLWGALTSHTRGIFFSLGLPAMEYGQIVTLIYLKVSISDFLTLFSARTRGFFFESRPGLALLLGAAFSLSLSTLLACYWPEGVRSGIPVMGLAKGKYRWWALWLWVYCVVCWLTQDTVKVLAYALHRWVSGTDSSLLPSAGHRSQTVRPSLELSPLRPAAPAPPPGDDNLRREASLGASAHGSVEGDDDVEMQRGRTFMPLSYQRLGK